MMKKIILLLVCFCCMFFTESTVFATKVPPFSTQGYFYGIPRFLGGDKNILCVEVSKGIGVYLDRSSIRVEKNEPPQHIIAVNVYLVPDVFKGSTKVTNVLMRRFFYNTDLREMYCDRDGNSNWQYIDPEGSMATTSVIMPAGEMAFYLVYHEKFYGSGSHYGHVYGRNIPNFTDDFYRF